MDDEDRLEILSIHMLDQERSLVTDLKRLARRLDLEFGWHYLLDLAWILRHLGPARGRRIMDAGAGVGIMQWHLADRGAEVISVDRQSRANLARRFHMVRNSSRVGRPVGKSSSRAAPIARFHRW